jgi:putative ATP-dependent endonuclease of OLD family
VARIRRLEIRNFRSIRSLDWTPSAGVNCLVGPGDSGKSSILDAIDYCIGARRTLPISDTDFFRLNVDQPILISVTLGDLPRELQNLEGFGDFLRGYDLGTQRVEDEPGLGIDTVLTLRVKVESDLEPVWSLYSERAEAQGLERGLGWKDRRKLVPARIGGYTASNLSWTRGSVLNRLTEEQPDLGVELARAAREARARFGNQAEAQFRETLRKVTETAGSLGVPVGVAAQALLDAHSVSIGDGAISLHDATGVPLRSLGTGSSRLRRGRGGHDRAGRRGGIWIGAASALALAGFSRCEIHASTASSLYDQPLAGGASRTQWKSGIRSPASSRSTRCS